MPHCEVHLGPEKPVTQVFRYRHGLDKTADRADEFAQPVVAFRLRIVLVPVDSLGEGTYDHLLEATVGTLYRKHILKRILRA